MRCSTQSLFEQVLFSLREFILKMSMNTVIFLRRGNSCALVYNEDSKQVSFQPLYTTTSGRGNNVQLSTPMYRIIGSRDTFLRCPGREELPRLFFIIAWPSFVIILSASQNYHFYGHRVHITQLILVDSFAKSKVLRMPFPLRFSFLIQFSDHHAQSCLPPPLTTAPATAT